MVMVCVPDFGHCHANNTVWGMLLLELDLFCQIAEVSVVSTPSMNPLAWPSSQQASPNVPIRAIPLPVKVIKAGNDEVVILVVVAVAFDHALFTVGEPVGSSPAAATISEKPPLVMYSVIMPTGGGPLKKRPNEPVEGSIAETAAAAL